SGGIPSGEDITPPSGFSPSGGVSEAATPGFSNEGGIQESAARWAAADGNAMSEQRKRPELERQAPGVRNLGDPAAPPSGFTGAAGGGIHHGTGSSTMRGVTITISSRRFSRFSVKEKSDPTNGSDERSGMPARLRVTVVVVRPPVTAVSPSRTRSRVRVI